MHAVHEAGQGIPARPFLLRWWTAPLLLVAGCGLRLCGAVGSPRATARRGHVRLVGSPSRRGEQAAAVVKNGGPLRIEPRQGPPLFTRATDPGVGPHSGDSPPAQQPYGYTSKEGTLSKTASDGTPKYKSDKARLHRTVGSTAANDQPTVAVHLASPSLGATRIAGSAPALK